MGWLKRALQQATAAGLRVPGLRQVARATGRSGLLPQSVWRRIPITGPIRFRLEDSLEVTYHSHLMDHLGRFLFFGGEKAWEPELVRVLPGLARNASGIIDVGAHTGLFTLVALAANPAARGIALEPVLTNAQLLQTNLRANGLAARCVIAAAAVAAESGTVAFDPGPIEIPMTSGIRESMDANAIRVPALSIDSIANWLPSVDLIKIDVEGFEHLVLAGGQTTLAASRPTLVVECLPGSRIEEFADVWERLGYRRFHLLPQRVEPIDRIAASENSPTHNYLLAARPEILKLITGSSVAAGLNAR